MRTLFFLPPDPVFQRLTLARKVAGWLDVVLTLSLLVATPLVILALGYSHQIATMAAVAYLSGVVLLVVAAVLKAYLNREIRLYPLNDLRAVLELPQRIASYPDLKPTFDAYMSIRDTLPVSRNNRYISYFLREIGKKVEFISL
jgi:hypothetical protein